MKRFAGLVALLIVLLAVIQPVQRVLADDVPWECTFDFLTAPGDDWSTLDGLGHWTEGSGWVADYIPPGSNPAVDRYNYIRLVYEPADPNAFIDVTYNYTVDTTYGLDGIFNVYAYACATGGSCSSGSTIAGFNDSAGAHTVSYIFDDGVPVALDAIGIWIQHAALDYRITSAVVSGLGVSPCEDGGGGGTLTRPLTSSDEASDIVLYDTTKIANMAQAFLHEFNVYDVLHSGGAETVQAWSETAGAQVHAATDATVESVRSLSWSDCGIGQYYPHNEGAEITGADFYDFPAASFQPCLVELYDTSLIGDVADVPWPGYGDQSSVYKQRYYLDPTDVYIVTLRVADMGRLVYLVKNANTFVIQGDTIEAGCVLGTTVPLTAEPVQAVNFNTTGAVAGVVAVFSGGTLAFAAGAVAAIAGLLGVAVPPLSPVATPHGITTISLYADDDTIQPLLDQLTIEPTNQDKCAGTGQYSDCNLDNPTFSDNGFGWEASGNVEWLEPGVILDPLEQVRTTLNLDPEADYTVTVYAEGLDGAESEIRIWLGDNTGRVAVPVEWTSLQLETTPVGDPDAGTFHTVGIQNTGSQSIVVRSVCVTDGAPNLGPNSCYFNNQSFQQGISGWDVSEGVEVADEALNVPDDGVISQNVMLNPLPGGAATYKLVVRGDWWYTGELDTVSGATAIAQIQYEWPDGSGYINMVPVTIHANLAYGQGLLVYAADINVSSTTDAVMNLKVSTTTAGDMDVQGIRITSACLSAPNGGPFPGQGGGSAPPPLSANCEYVSRPQNNDPAAWLQWHWEKSNQFFKCDLMVLLNKMYTLGKQSYTLAGWQARYMQSTMRAWSDWMGKQLFPWFNGQFRNIAIGQVTTVYQSGGSCNDLFCVLNSLITGVLTPINNIVNTLLGLINTAANLFLTILTGIIGLGLSFLARIFSIFNQATGLLSGIITAYSTATPITVEGMPICGIDPTSSPFCRATWLLDNTILGGRWGVLLTLIIAIATIHLILWAIGEFRNAIVKTGSAA